MATSFDESGISRRRWLGGAAASLAACRRRGAAGEVNIYCWSDYIASDTVAGFEGHTGIRVNYETFESQEEMLAKILAGGVRWDVVFPGNTLVGPMVRRGLLQKIDGGRLPNLDNLDRRYLAPPWDSGDGYTVPYLWGVTGIVYNSRRLGKAPSGWGDLWEAALRRKVTMLDDPSEVLGACLKKLGYGLNSVQARELEAAQAEALRQKPLVRAYINAEVKPQLIAGDVWAAQLWNGDALQAMAENPDLKFCYPAEGVAVFVDSAAILSQAPNPANACRWIDYLLRPDIAASIAQATLFASPNARAVERIEERLRNNPDIYPSPERLARAEWFTEIPPAGQELRDRLWTEIKAAG